MFSIFFRHDGEHFQETSSLCPIPLNFFSFKGNKPVKNCACAQFLQFHGEQIALKPPLCPNRHVGVAGAAFKPPPAASPTPGAASKPPPAASPTAGSAFKPPPSQSKPPQRSPTSSQSAPAPPPQHPSAQFPFRNTGTTVPSACTPSMFIPRVPIMKSRCCIESFAPRAARSSLLISTPPSRFSG